MYVGLDTSDCHSVRFAAWIRFVAGRRPWSYFCDCFHLCDKVKLRWAWRGWDILATRYPRRCRKTVQRGSLAPCSLLCRRLSAPMIANHVIVGCYLLVSLQYQSLSVLQPLSFDCQLYFWLLITLYFQVWCHDVEYRVCEGSSKLSRSILQFSALLIPPTVWNFSFLVPTEGHLLPCIPWQCTSCCQSWWSAPCIALCSHLPCIYYVKQSHGQFCPFVRQFDCLVGLSSSRINPL